MKLGTGYSAFLTNYIAIEFEHSRIPIIKLSKTVTIIRFKFLTAGTLNCEAYWRQIV